MDSFATNVLQIETTASAGSSPWGIGEIVPADLSATDDGEGRGPLACQKVPTYADFNGGVSLLVWKHLS